MLNINMLKIRYFMEELKNKYQQNYGLMEPEFGNILAWAGSLALENISNSDALYHNVDHTIMVTLAGQEIIRGKHLKEGGVTPADWLHYVLALLMHDIGYVRGICKLDKNGIYATGVGNETAEIPSSGTDAVLAKYHVDRGKMFIRERFADQKDIDAEIVASYIEMTRFPCPGDKEHSDTKGLGGLTRAADFIGQLGDPNHMNNMPALFYELTENGQSKEDQYKSPGDMRSRYPRFFWDVVYPYIQDAMDYLNITQEGKLWVSNLHAHVFAAEHYEP